MSESQSSHNPDFLSEYARKQAEAERAEAETRTAFEERVAGPARQLRPEWDAAWSALCRLLVPVWSAMRGEASRDALPEPPSLAAALKSVGEALARFDPICDARLEINPFLHDLTLRVKGIPNRPTGRLARVRDDSRFLTPAPRAAAEMLMSAVSDSAEVLTDRVRVVLADNVLRVAFGWFPFMRDCIWPPSSPHRPGPIQPLPAREDPIGAGPACDDWRQKIHTDDYRRAEILLAGEVPILNCDLFPEWDIGLQSERGDEPPLPTAAGTSGTDRDPRLDADEPPGREGTSAAETGGGAEPPNRPDQRISEDFGGAGTLIELGREVWQAVANHVPHIRECDVHALNNRMPEAVRQAMRVVPFGTAGYEEWERRVGQVRSACADLLRSGPSFLDCGSLLGALSRALERMSNAATAIRPQPIVDLPIEGGNAAPPQGAEQPQDRGGAETSAAGAAFAEEPETPTWEGLGDAKRAILTVLGRAVEPMQNPEIATKAGYKEGTLRHHYADLKAFGLITSTKDGYKITDAGRSLLPGGAL